MQKGKTMIDELMEKLLEEPVVDNNEIVFTSRAVELIHEISEKCKGIQIVEQTREQAEELHTLHDLEIPDIKMCLRNSIRPT